MGPTAGSARSTTSGSSRATRASKISAAGRGQIGVDDTALAVQIRSVRRRGGSFHPSAGAAGELPHRWGGAAHDGGDVVEGHVEHVVQDEREPLGRGQRVEHHEQCQADRVRQHRFVFGVAAVFVSDDRVVCLDVERFLAPLLA